MTGPDSGGDPAGAVAIDWETAEVRDGSLKVGLTERPSKDWRTRLEAVASRLEQPGHHWGQVRASKRHLKVADVPAGHESELRHLLEAAVLQTNADLPSPAAPSESKVSEVDQRMTDAFRARAESPPES